MASNRDLFQSIRDLLKLLARTLKSLDFIEKSNTYSLCRQIEKIEIEITAISTCGILPKPLIDDLPTTLMVGSTPNGSNFNRLRRTPWQDSFSSIVEERKSTDEVSLNRIDNLFNNLNKNTTSREVERCVRFDDFSTPRVL